MIPNKKNKMFAIHGGNDTTRNAYHARAIYMRHNSEWIIATEKFHFFFRFATTKEYKFCERIVRCSTEWFQWFKWFLAIFDREEKQFSFSTHSNNIISGLMNSFFRPFRLLSFLWFYHFYYRVVSNNILSYFNRNRWNCRPLMLNE